MHGVGTDPVCGMKVDAETAKWSVEHAGLPVYFCCQGCLKKFEADPSAYDASHVATPLQPAAAPATVGRVRAAGYVCPMHPEVIETTQKPCPKCGMALDPVDPAASVMRVEYTCPMHPEIVREQAGSCPICGMALQARTVSLDEAPNDELIDMTRRFRVGLALTLPLLVFMVLDMQHVRWLSGSALGWLEFVLATPVVLWCGWPFLERGWSSIVHRSPNMFTLIAIGAGAAYFYSVVAIFVPGIFPATLRTNPEHLDLYFESSAVIIVLVLLGQVLELRARDRTGDALRALLGLSPKTARRIEDHGGESEVPLHEIKIGDLIRVRPGEKVPTDGVIVEGRSAVDEAMITGESMPVEKDAGAAIYGGTVNGTGTLVLRAERIGPDTLLAQIVRMVAEAQRTRAPIQRLADKTAAWFVPIVLAVALITAVAWGVFGPQPRYAHALINAVAVLIIACPCALGLATPMSIVVGTGRGAAGGILVRDAEALEIFGKVDTFVIDKTGTLTEGKPRLTKLLPCPGIDARHLLCLAASLESGSEHPLASAIVIAAKKEAVALVKVEGFEAVAGQGVIGQVGGHKVAIGNEPWMKTMGVTFDELGREQVERLRSQGESVFFIAVDDRCAGLASVADPLKPSTRETVAQLKRQGVKIIMITGDHQTTAAAIAGELEIDFTADVLPQRKAAVIKDLQKEGRIVAMVGDGINDAPALAQADVGVAMGTGADVAIAAGGITLISGDLQGLLKARTLSQRTMSVIRQNLFFAFFYNGLGVPLAAGVLYPFSGVLLNPMISAAAMSLSSVCVIANSLRLRSLKL